MALPSSGPISFSQIRSEWNLSGPVLLSTFYKGAPYFKSNKAVQQTNALTNIPTRGQEYRLSYLYGKYRYYFYTFSVSSGSYISLGTGTSITSNFGNYSADSDVRPSTLPTDRPIYAEVTLNSGVVTNGLGIDDDQAGYRAFVGQGGADCGSITYLINNGSIYGVGGNGGAGAAIDSNGSSGTKGGAAICYGRNLYLENYGIVYGGGGGGGGGAYSYEGSDGGSDTRSAGGGGGGGQGSTGGVGGVGGPLPPASGAFGGRNAAGSPGSNGSFSGPGSGGGGGGPSNWGPCAGGTGGTWGQPGTAGQAVTAGSQDTQPGSGGPSGEAIRRGTKYSFCGGFSFVSNSGSLAGPVDTTTPTGGGGGGPNGCTPSKISDNLSIYRSNCTINYAVAGTTSGNKLFDSTTSFAQTTTTVRGDGQTFANIIQNINSYYKTAIGRPAEQDGLNFYVQVYINNPSLTYQQLYSQIYSAYINDGEQAKGTILSYADSCGSSF